MLKRKAYDALLKWKMTPGHKCLMIKGARQVGKTYLTREFGKNEYPHFVEINFIKNPALKEIFSGDLDADTIYKRITAFMFDAVLEPGKTLIFLDEIQTCGRARTALKFLAEDGRYDVIASGSLLGLTYGEDDDPLVELPESNPTGYEEFLTMHSLDFEEFLWAVGVDSKRIDILRDYFEKSEKIPDVINEKYEELFREFMVVGGMPEVVANFAKNKDFAAVHSIQKRILDDYGFDITKHAKGAEKVKVKACYDSIPGQLSKELTKFQYGYVEKGKTSKKYAESIRWLVDSALVNISYAVGEPYIPLLGNAKPRQFKLYTNDTGLLSASLGFEAKKAILTNTIKGNVKGGIYENVIGECIVKSGRGLYYYRPDSEHEIEFLIEKDGEVEPIEVKSGNSPTASLNAFVDAYHPAKAYKLINGNIGTVDGKKSLPHYMVLFI
ncbi:MAG: ATP-binding protein [Bacilli bacterium]|nr:ATP-binding protein [Bacilli bacterium]